MDSNTLQHGQAHGRESGLVDQVANPQGGQRGKLGRLEDDGVSGGECGTDLPREHQQGELHVHRNARRIST